MDIKSCCKHLLRWHGDQSQSVLCKNWLLPIRLMVVVSLLGHLLWWVFHPVVFYTVVIVIIHCTVAMRLLLECRESERYYQTVEEFERRQAVLKDDPV
jgi:hypothetical protein